MSEKISVVTGASGHVGYPLVKLLCDSGEKVRILIRKDLPIFDCFSAERVYGDVTDPESLEKAFEGADVVYHLAGMIEIKAGNDEPVWRVNVDGTKNVVEACKKCGVKRLVYASSVDAIPPLPDNQEMTEIYDFNPDNLEGTYAKTKAAATNYVLNNNGVDGLETVVTHPGACIGPYDFKVSSVGEMVRMFVNGAFPVTLTFGAYNFVDVRDVANGMYLASTKGTPGHCYILTGNVMTCGELISCLAKICGRKDPKIPLSRGLANTVAPLMEVYYKALDKTPLFTRYSIRKLCSNCNFSYKKAADDLGYAPMSAEQSFADMVAWIKENEPKKKKK